MALPVKIGPFGGDGGVVVDIHTDQLPKTLDNIEIWSSSDRADEDTVIKGIRFTYTDTKGTQHIVGPWGTTENPAAYHPFPIDKESGDYISKIEGMMAEFETPPYDGGVVITSLTLTTKQEQKLTCGNPNFGTKFTVPLQTGGIFAFFGRAKECSHINALGFYSQNP